MAAGTKKAPASSGKTIEGLSNSGGNPKKNNSESNHQEGITVNTSVSETQTPNQSPTHCPTWCIEDHTGYDGGEIFHSGTRTALIGKYANVEDIYPVMNLTDSGVQPDEWDVGVYVFGDIEMMSIAEARRFITLLQDAIAKAEEVAR